MHFSEMMCIPSKTVTIYNNTKACFNKKIQRLQREKHKAFMTGDKGLAL